VDQDWRRRGLENKVARGGFACALSVKSKGRLNARITFHILEPSQGRTESEAVWYLSTACSPQGFDRVLQGWRLRNGGLQFWGGGKRWADRAIIGLSLPHLAAVLATGFIPFRGLQRKSGQRQSG